MRLRIAIALLLAALTVATYWRALDNDFIRAFDDIEYVLGNPHVQQGITPAFMKWAFTSVYYSNWSPLTWISHAIDVQMLGIDSARGHHAVNIALHAMNAMLLFVALAKLTGATWRSAMVAALFAVHPTHVESVAWISERKDVLCAFFGLLAMLAYVGFARGAGSRRRIMYALTLVCFALSLMAKQMFVTLPAVLLLLDIWPLRRVRFDSIAANDVAASPTQPITLRAAIVEKLPMLVIALAASAVAFFAQSAGQSVRDLQSVPLATRLAAAIVSYFEYVRMTFWPSGLAIFYPYRDPVPAMDVLLALIGVSVITGFAWRFRRTKPYLIIGWLLYLGMLVPVIGLVQIGEQSHADRYTYIPTIGIFIAIVWLLADLAKRSQIARYASIVACFVALALLTLVSTRQVARWRDAETLFAHALRVTRNNWLAHNNYGTMLLERGETTGALDHFKRSIAIRPDYVFALCNAADAALLLNRPEVAAAYLQKAASIEKLPFISTLNYANALAMSGRLDDAETQIAAARNLDAGDPQPLTLLGQIRAAQSRHAEALELFEAALRLDADNAEAHFQAAQSLIALDRSAEARAHLESVMRITPDDAQARQLLESLSPPATHPSSP